MKTIKIKGKDYVMVKVRVQEFRKEHPDWTIKTKVKVLDENQVVMQALVLNEEGRVIADGWAAETKDSFINKTSYVENCQTSAIGRALGFMGIGIDGEIASAEELRDVQDATPEQLTNIETLMDSSTIDEDTRRRIEDSFVTLTYPRAQDCINFLLLNQRDKIEAGDGYNQSDIHKKLDLIDNDPKK